jgi:Flp pilus assembly protein CpaB
VDEAALRAVAGRLVEAVGGRRRLVAAACAAVAVVSGLRAVHPSPVRTVAVWAAARDLSGGAPLVSADLTTVRLPVTTVPAGAVRAGVRVGGRLLAAPMRRGEPLTDVRLLEPSLLAALPEPGLVAVPVRIADGSAAAALVRPGDRIDVLAIADPTAGAPARTQTVASAVQVLAVPGRDPGTGDGRGLVVVAATPAEAAALAQASAGTRLSLALVRPAGAA